MYFQTNSMKNNKGRCLYIYIYFCFTACFGYYFQGRKVEKNDEKIIVRLHNYLQCYDVYNTFMLFT